MKDKTIAFHLISNHRFNTKDGFKLIYEEMKSRNSSFDSAVKRIFSRRNICIASIKCVIDSIEREQLKEKHDYIHAKLTNNINN